LASQGVLERFGIVSHRRGEVVARAVLKRKAKEMVSVLFDASKNSLPKREKKNQKISQIWRRVKHRTHDVYTNGVDNKTNSLDLTRVLLLERTHERVKNELKNERMNETAFDSIARSFFRSLFKKARENARAKVNRISHHLHHHPTWKTSSIGISLSPRARV
jgi:hypothetical protein